MVPATAAWPVERVEVLARLPGHLPHARDAVPREQQIARSTKPAVVNGEVFFAHRQWFAR